MKQIYDLSYQTMAAEDQRVLVADSGKEYNVSFRPAILNRKYFQRWGEFQKEIMRGLQVFVAIQSKVNSGHPITKEQEKQLADFTKLSEEAADAGAELLVFAMRANGYDDFDQDELYANFSVEGIARAINFVMGMEDPEDLKKKLPVRKVNFKA